MKQFRELPLTVASGGSAWSRQTRSLLVTGEGFSTVEARTANPAAINAATAASSVLVQKGIEQDPLALPNGVTRAHTPIITRSLGLIKVSSPIAWLSQLWLLRHW